jgi:hypothetical protein
MVTIPARVPSPADVDELASRFAEAISLLDEIKPRERPLTVASWTNDSDTEPQHLTVAEIGVMFLAADEALDAADAIREYGEQIIAALPDLAGRDDGGTYATRFAREARD